MESTADHCDARPADQRLCLDGPQGQTRSNCTLPAHLNMEDSAVFGLCRSPCRVVLLYFAHRMESSSPSSGPHKSFLAHNPRRCTTAALHRPRMKPLAIGEVPRSERSDRMAISTASRVGPGLRPSASWPLRPQELEIQEGAPFFFLAWSLVFGL